MYVFANAENTLIRAPDGSIIPASASNSDYLRLVNGDDLLGIPPVTILPYSRWRTLEDAKAELVTEIKALTKTTITDNLPEWRQMNLLARKLELDDIIDKRPLTTDELTEATMMVSAWAFVKAARALSNMQEAAVEALGSVEEAEAFTPAVAPTPAQVEAMIVWPAGYLPPAKRWWEVWK
jgi:hypothetical protein